MKKKVKDLKPGDVILEWYKILTVQNTNNNLVLAEVQFLDGGKGTREWANPNHEVDVRD